MAGRIVLIGLGSNVGDRAEHLRVALQRLGSVPGIAVVRASAVVESELVGDGPAQGKFLNAVAELRTNWPAVALLALCGELETMAGRVRPAPRNHPRPLDLDLLFDGDLHIDSRELVLPHPRWHEREFVCGPLRELGYDLAALPKVERPAVIESPVAMAAQCSRWLAGGCVVGLVPTMGSLHRGHASLMELARQECDRVVATIFVNPLQFGPGEDFAAYPRDLTGDVRLCKQAGVDAVFAPTVAQMYDPEFCSQVAVGPAAATMEGALRPGHFAGVATVVARLFALARPQRAYFGEKDAQQLAVIRRMQKDLGFPLQVVGCPIVRETDGLAMSSRNVYLSAEDRAASTVLSRALASAQFAWQQGERDRDRLLARARVVMAAEPRAQVDYIELRRDVDLAELPAGPVADVRMLIAARFAGGVRPVRLLDNARLGAGSWS